MTGVGICDNSHPSLDHTIPYFTPLLSVMMTKEGGSRVEGGVGQCGPSMDMI